MTEPARKIIHTFAEYLATEEASPTKHEFLNGEIFDMAGGTIEHARLTARVSGVLGAQLRGKRCEAYSSDLLVRVRATGLATYPDISVICGRLERDPETPRAVNNPIVLVEVLSDGTEGYDRGEKFAHYRRLPSLQEYVLVSQHEQRIEIFRRHEEGWMLHEAGKGERAKLLSIDCELPVDEIYANALEEDAAG